MHAEDFQEVPHQYIPVFSGGDKVRSVIGELAKEAEEACVVLSMLSKTRYTKVGRVYRRLRHRAVLGHVTLENLILIFWHFFPGDPSGLA